MKIDTIKFRDWVLKTDPEFNSEVYSKGGNSSALSCGCDNCLEFNSLKEEIYPEEIKSLFKQLGIDFKKEAEVSYLAIENGMKLYIGFFHFKGAFEGKDCTIETANGYVLELTPITKNFHIGFRIDNSLSFFEEKDQLVQIEFEARIPTK